MPQVKVSPRDHIAIDAVALAAWSDVHHGFERALWLDCLMLLLPTLFEYPVADMRLHLHAAMVEGLGELYGAPRPSEQHFSDLSLTLLLHHISGVLARRMSHGYEFGLACFWDAPVLGTKYHQLLSSEQRKKNEKYKRKTLNKWLKRFMAHKNDEDFLEELALWKQDFQCCILEKNALDERAHTSLKKSLKGEGEEHEEGFSSCSPPLKSSA